MVSSKEKLIPVLKREIKALKVEIRSNVDKIVSKVNSKEVKRSIIAKHVNPATIAVKFPNDFYKLLRRLKTK